MEKKKLPALFLPKQQPPQQEAVATSEPMGVEAAKVVAGSTQKNYERSSLRETLSDIAGKMDSVSNSLSEVSTTLNQTSSSSISTINNAFTSLQDGVMSKQLEQLVKLNESYTDQSKQLTGGLGDLSKKITTLTNLQRDQAERLALEKSRAAAAAEEASLEAKPSTILPKSGKYKQETPTAEKKPGLLSSLSSRMGGGGVGMRALKMAAVASLASRAGGRLGEAIGGEQGQQIGEVAGGALGALGASGLFRRKAATPATVQAPVAQPALQKELPQATPVSKPPVGATPPPLTPEQKAKYDDLRKQGIPAAEAKAQATKPTGFSAYAEKEKAILEKTGKAVPAQPVPQATPEVPSTSTAPKPTPTAAPVEAAGKKGILKTAAGIGGKALRFIPGVGMALAAGEAAYSSATAAADAEKVLGLKEGQKATTGERVAAGAGGLTESLSFGLISKESAGRFYKGLTGAGTPTTEAAKQLGETKTSISQVDKGQVNRPTAPPPPTVTAADRQAASATGAGASIPSAPAAAPMVPPPIKSIKTAEMVTKPKIKISGDEDVKAMIKQHEGVRTRPYKDSLGLWTVGVGHLIGDGKTLPPEWNREFSMQEVNTLFEEDYAHHKKAAQKIPGFSGLNNYGQGALTDLTFNMGPTWYTKWPALQKQLKDGDTEGAAENLQSSKWFTQVGTRGPTIVSLMRAGGDQPKKESTQTAAATGVKQSPVSGEGTLMSASGPVMSGSGAPIGTGESTSPPPAAPAKAEEGGFFASVKSTAAKIFGGGQKPAAATTSMPSISAPPMSADVGGVVGQGEAATVVSADSITKVVKPKDSSVNLQGLNPAFKQRFAAMAAEYETMTGKKMQVNSGFRDPKEQAELFAKYGSPRAAPPGRSRHESGVAIDINSSDANKAIELGLFAKYGFTRPVPGETWHVEPVETAKQGGVPDNPFAPGQAIAVAGKGGKAVIPSAGTPVAIPDKKAPVSSGSESTSTSATTLPKDTQPTATPVSSTAVASTAPAAPAGSPAAPGGTPAGAAPAAAPVSTVQPTQLAISAGQAPGGQAPAVSAAGPEPIAMPRQSNVAALSERVGAASAAPVIVNNVSNNNSSKGGAPGGAPRGIPAPYGDRGSLAVGTTFIAAA